MNIIYVDITDKKNISPGLTVLIIERDNKISGILTKGVIKEVLSKSDNDKRGIKVRLENGKVGRIKHIFASRI